jgi:hypothetical protein
MRLRRLCSAAQPVWGVVVLSFVVISLAAAFTYHVPSPATAGLGLAPAQRAAVAGPLVSLGARCRLLARARAVLVVRSGSAPGRRSFALPERMRLRGAIGVRALAGALCSVPPAGDTVYHCPADFFLRYAFRFEFAALPSVVAIVDPFGCELIMGAGPRRTAALAPGFWHKLGASLGLPHATLATFRGSA